MEDNNREIGEVQEEEVEDTEFDADIEEALMEEFTQKCMDLPELAAPQQYAMQLLLSDNPMQNITKMMQDISKHELFSAKSTSIIDIPQDSLFFQKIFSSFGLKPEDLNSLPCSQPEMSLEEKIQEIKECEQKKDEDGPKKIPVMVAESLAMMENVSKAIGMDQKQILGFVDTLISNLEKSGKLQDISKSFGADIEKSLNEDKLD